MYVTCRNGSVNCQLYSTIGIMLNFQSVIKYQMVFTLSILRVTSCVGEVIRRIEMLNSWKSIGKVVAFNFMAGLMIAVK